MTGDAVVLEVTGLRVVLGGEVIIEHLSFTVERGEVLTILGPNGAGKTVLLRALLGIVPHEGVITWRGGVRTAYVPQRVPYVRDVPLTVADFFGLKKRAAIGVREALTAVGLGEELAGQRMGVLSFGQFQRVLIAWALAGDPQVLLFDEPTAGVDVGGAETVYALLDRLHRERHLAMLIVTHDLSVVSKLSDTVLCLNKRWTCRGAPLTVLTPENLQKLYGAEVKYYPHRHE
jgi:zinc transport system ATP-binding protein